jgi:uncharacterized membrane protein YhaH (DUF805 family)
VVSLGVSTGPQATLKEGRGIMDMFEGIFIAWAVITGLLIILAICHVTGLCIMRLRDRRTGKMRLYYIRRAR